MRRERKSWPPGCTLLNVRSSERTPEPEPVIAGRAQKQRVRGGEGHTPKVGASEQARTTRRDDGFTRTRV